MENKKLTFKERFRIQPLFFFLFPIALCVLAAFPGFSQGRFAIAYFDANGPVEAGSVSLFEAFNLVGGMSQILFYIGLSLSISIALYAVIAAFVPKIRGAVPFFVPTLCVLAFGAAASAWGHLLLGFRVDAITTDYFLSIDQVVQKSHALTRTTLTFIVSGSLSLLLWIWWIWAFILTFRARAKELRMAAKQPKQD